MNLEQARRRVDRLMKLQADVAKSRQEVRGLPAEERKAKRRKAIKNSMNNNAAKVFGLKELSLQGRFGADPILFGAYSKNKQHYAVLTISEALQVGFTESDCVYGGI